MKNHFKVLAVFLFLFMSSCGDDLVELEDLLSIDVNTEVSKTFEVLVTSGEKEYFNKQEVLNINNKETQQYIDNIKNVSIQKLTFKLKNFNGADTQGSIEGEFFADTQLLLSKTINIKSACDAEMIYEITNLDEINMVANKFKNGENVTLGLKGTSSSQSQITFDVVVYVSLVVTAAP